MAKIEHNSISIDTEKSTITWNGIEIPQHICSDIYFAYQYLSTAHELMDDYGISPEDAWNIAMQVRNYMENTGCSESEAIWEHMKHWS